MDLTDTDAPDPSDVADDPAGAVKQGASYSIGAGIVFTLLAIGWLFIARPAINGFESLKTAASNASDNVDTSESLEVF